MATLPRSRPWRIQQDVLDLIELVLVDFATLTAFIIILKAGEFELGLAFSESHPAVQTVRGFMWIPFIIVYFICVYLDLRRLIRRREERW